MVGRRKPNSNSIVVTEKLPFLTGIQQLLLLFVTTILLSHINLLTQHADPGKYIFLGHRTTQNGPKLVRGK